MTEELLFPVKEYGYDIAYVNEQVESLKTKIAELTESNNNLINERDELYKNCVVFAKKIKKLETVYEDKNVKSFKAEPTPAVSEVDVDAAVQNVPEKYTCVDFDELFDMLSNADSETATYVDEFKYTVDNIVSSVRKKADSLISKARSEHENIINDAKTEAQRIINENIHAKEKLENAYKQLSAIFTDAENRLFD